MFARSLQKATKETSKPYIGKRGIFYFDRDLQLVADSMRRNLGRSSRRGCNPFDYHRHNHYFVEPVQHQQNHSTYEKKTIINDEDGRIVVKTVRKTPGRPWETHVEEYFNKQALEQGKKPEAQAQTQSQKSETTNKTTESRGSNAAHQAGREQSNTQHRQTVEQTNSNRHAQKTEAADHANRSQAPTENAPRRHPAQHHERDVFGQFDREFREISNAFTRDFDSFFGRSFNPRSLFEDNSFLAEPQYTNYTSKTVLNDNGNVTVKTTRKNAENQWETKIENYNTNGEIEGDKKVDASAEAKKDDQMSVKNPTKDQSSNHRTQDSVPNSANSTVN